MVTPNPPVKNQLPPPPLVTNDPTLNRWFHDITIRSQVWHGKVVPNDNDGRIGDWYADVVAKHIYVKLPVTTSVTDKGTWTLII